MTARPRNPRPNRIFAWTLLATLILLAGFVLLQTHGKTVAAASPAATQQRALAAYGNLPLAFEPNQGQTDPQVKYMARGNGYTLFLTNQEAVLSLLGPAKSNSKTTKYSSKGERYALRMKMMGANPQPEIAAEQSLPGKSNYYVGNDPSKWQTGVPEFARVSYRNVYPGIDLDFHGAQKQTEFDFLVNPEANAQIIGLSFSGAQAMRIDKSGALLIATSAGDVRLHRPIAYQENQGARQPVGANFVLAANHQVKFALGDYDHSRQLIIDPSVLYSTYIGGTGEDQATAVVIDSGGNAYITGEAGNSSFPHTSGSFNASAHDVYVLKLNASGTALSYSTLFGGTTDQSGNAIALDPTGTGDVFVAGGTSSTDFPTTAGVLQASPQGGLDGFVAKFSSSGSMLYSTYLGGSSDDDAAAIAVDSSGNAYVGGQTLSTNFPTQNAFQGALGGGMAFDGFFTELNPAASAKVYSTYMGGSGADIITAVTLDSNNKVYVAGNTASTDFPITSGVVQSTYGGGGDAFVAEFDSTKSGSPSLIYSTFLGGSATDNAYGIVVDTSFNSYITGSTMSSNFPKTSGVVQSSLAGTQNAFVTKLNSTGTALTFSTYLGGSNDTGLAIALDSAKTGSSVYVTGQAGSGFPLASPTQATFGGGTFDAFVSQLNSTASSLSFSTYLGGSGEEDVVGTGVSGGIAVDGSGDIYVAGDTLSTDFPVTTGALQATFGGGTPAMADAFVAKISPSGTAGFTVTTTPTSATVTHGNSTSPFTATVAPTNGFSGTVTLTCSGLPTGAACGFNPATVTTSGTSTLTITTMARSASLIDNHKRGIYFAFLIVPGLALVGVGFAPGKSNKQKLLGFVMCCMLFSGLAFMAACGGGSSGGGGGGGGTPPGTYSVIVGGTSGGVTASGTTTISLTVQ